MTDEPKRRGRPPKAQTFPMRVLRDFWDEDRNRIRKGTVIDMEPGAAMDGIEAGMVERVK